jgi:hypothetical protein
MKDSSCPPCSGRRTGAATGAGASRDGDGPTAKKAWCCSGHGDGELDCRAAHAVDALDCDTERRNRIGPGRHSSCATETLLDAAGIGAGDTEATVSQRRAALTSGARRYAGAAWYC